MKAITNEEKAIELAENISPYDIGGDNAAHYAAKDAALNAMWWKDEQIKQILIEKTKLLSPSAAQDSVKRCTIEEIYRELFNEEIPNSNPYIK